MKITGFATPSTLPGSNRHCRIASRATDDIVGAWTALLMLGEVTRQWLSMTTSTCNAPLTPNARAPG
ncbi:MAG TPA: hypothetical protein VE010_07680, partial [Thermoanaerobaculia bacterium]|nr:hypothetical protein [Thermoanaerobaculia bacterium]